MIPWTMTSFKSLVFWAYWKKQCCGSASVSMGSRIHLLILKQIRIRIQGVHPMRIHPDQDPGQTLPSQRVEFKIKIYLRRYGTGLLARLEIKFIYRFGQFPCSWIRIRIHNTNPIRIHKRQINADPRGSGSESGSTTMVKSELSTQNATCSAMCWRGFLVPRRD